MDPAKGAAGAPRRRILLDSDGTAAFGCSYGSNVLLLERCALTHTARPIVFVLQAAAVAALSAAALAIAPAAQAAQEAMMVAEVRQL